MEPKFKIFQFVLVSGNATGYGDLTGWITEITIDNIYNEPYYTIKVFSIHTSSVFVAEKFIKDLFK